MVSFYLMENIMGNKTLCVQLYSKNIESAFLPKNFVLSVCLLGNIVAFDEANLTAPLPI